MLNNYIVIPTRNKVMKSISYLLILRWNTNDVLLTIGTIYLYSNFVMWDILNRRIGTVSLKGIYYCNKNDKKEFLIFIKYIYSNSLLDQKLCYLSYGDKSMHEDRYSERSKRNSTINSIISSDLRKSWTKIFFSNTNHVN